tara:strand:+ start:649 stop:1134 length:486 start_codon:yes stop_codon:yes gene_type:complete
MPTPTYTLIDSVTLGSTAASVTFSGISATGKGDLVLAVTASSASGGGFQVRINGDSGASYPYVQMFGNGSSAISNGSSSETGLTGSYVRTYPVMQTYQIQDFAATDKHKAILSRNNAASNETRAVASRWASTSAVTSISATISANTFDVGSTFFLYQLVSE